MRKFIFRWKVKASAFTLQHQTDGGHPTTVGLTGFLKRAETVIKPSFANRTHKYNATPQKKYPVTKTPGILIAQLLSPFMWHNEDGGRIPALNGNVRTRHTKQKKAGTFSHIVRYTNGFCFILGLGLFGGCLAYSSESSEENAEALTCLQTRAEALEPLVQQVQAIQSQIQAFSSWSPVSLASSNASEITKKLEILGQNLSSLNERGTALSQTLASLSDSTCQISLLSTPLADVNDALSSLHTDLASLSTSLGVPAITSTSTPSPSTDTLSGQDHLQRCFQTMSETMLPLDSYLTTLITKVQSLSTWRYHSPLVKAIAALAPALRNLNNTLLPCFPKTALCLHDAVSRDRTEAGENLASHLLSLADLLDSQDHTPSLVPILETFRHSCLDQALDACLLSCVPLVNFLKYLATTEQWPSLLTGSLDDALATSSTSFSDLWTSCETLLDSLTNDKADLSETSLRKLSAVNTALSTFVSAVTAWVPSFTLPDGIEAFALTALPSYASATDRIKEHFSSLLAALNDALTSLTTKLNNGSILFPYKTKLIDLIEEFAAKDAATVVKNLFQTASENVGYPLEATPITTALETTQTHLTSLKEAFKNPSCFKKLEITSQIVTQHALTLLALSESLQQDPSPLVGSLTQTTTWPLVSLLDAQENWANSIQVLLASPLTSFETLDTVNEHVETLAKTFWEPFATWWKTLVPASLPQETVTVRSFPEQVNVWQEALHAVAQVFQTVKTSVNTTPLWPFDTSHIAALMTASPSADTASSFLRLLSEELSGDLWIPYQHNNNLSTALITWADASSSLSKTLAEVGKALDSRCCFPTSHSLSSFLESLSYATLCLERAIPQNPTYADYLTSFNDPHEFLELVTRTFLPSLNQQLSQLASDIENFPLDEAQTFCHSPKLVESLAELSQLAQQFANQSQVFCQHLNVVLPEKLTISPIESVDLDSFWRPLFDILISFRLSLKTLSEFHNAHAYKIDTAQLFSLFQQLRQQFENLSSPLSRLRFIPPRSLCERCMPWPNLPLTTVQALWEQITELIPLPISSESCCQPYTEELALLQEQLSCFTVLQDIWLTCVEKNFLQRLDHHRSLSEEATPLFMEVMVPLVHQLSKLKPTFDDIISLFQVPSTCHALNGTPCLHEVRLALISINRILQAHLPKEVVDAVAPTLPVVKDATPCEERIFRVKALFQNLNSAIERWSVFANHWQALDNLQHSQTFIDTFELAHSFFDHLCIFLSQLRDLYTTSGQCSSFCPHCPSESTLRDSLTSLLETEENPLQGMATKACELCPVEISHARVNISLLLKQVTGLLVRLQESPNKIQALVNGHLLSFGNSLEAPLQRLADYLKASTPSSDLTSCLAERLRSLYNGIESQLEDLTSALQNWSDQNELPFLNLCSDPCTLHGNATILPLFGPLTTAWQGLCLQINALTPDICRQAGSSVLQGIGERLNSIIPLLTVFDTLQGQTFCNGHVLVVTPADKLQDFVSDLVAVTRAITQELHGNNCCDTHARCIYGVIQRFRPCLNILHQIPFKTQIHFITPYFLKISEILSSAQQKLSQKSTNEDKVCLLSRIEDEFINIETSTQQLIEQIHTYSDFPESRYVDWDHYSAHTKNDCACLKGLYEDLKSLCHKGLQEIITSATPTQPTALVQGSYGCSVLADALEGFLSTFSVRRPLCCTCATYTQHHVLRDIAKELSHVAYFFKQIASLPSLQKVRDTLPSTVNLLRQAVGDRRSSTSQPIECAFPPQALEQLSQHMSGLAHYLQQIAKAGENL